MSPRKWPRRLEDILDAISEIRSFVAGMPYDQFRSDAKTLKAVEADLMIIGEAAGHIPDDVQQANPEVPWHLMRAMRNRIVHVYFDIDPPPYTAVPDCMSDLERFLHATDDSLPVPVRAGLAHVQFETIYPFLDGNGRVGRLLITFLLCHAGVLREPLLYLSLHFKQNRSAYYELLDRVRRQGDWETWLEFFLEGVKEVSKGAVSAAERLSKMLRTDRGRIGATGRRAGSALRVHEALKARPILSMPDVCNATSLSFPAASSAMDLLVGLGIAKELTGKRRNRLFVYDRYLAILNDGTERP